MMDTVTTVCHARFRVSGAPDRHRTGTRTPLIIYLSTSSSTRHSSMSTVYYRTAYAPAVGVSLQTVYINYIMDMQLEIQWHNSSGIAVPVYICAGRRCQPPVCCAITQTISGRTNLLGSLTKSGSASMIAFFVACVHFISARGRAVSLSVFKPVPMSTARRAPTWVGL